MADVFLSYKREDARRAKEIADAIESHGFSVFFDAEIDVGEAWNRRIERELGAARCVAVLWSGRSSDSGVGEWVHNEARIGKTRGILAPAIIGDCQIPLEFSAVQAADLRAWRGDPAEVEWQKFIKRIGNCLLQAPKALGARPLRRRWIRWSAAIAVLALIIGGGGWAWLKQRAQEASNATAPPSVVVARLPPADIRDAIIKELNDYRAAEKCPQIEVWLNDTRSDYPDWHEGIHLAERWYRGCNAAAPASTQVAQAVPAIAGAFLDQLRARDAKPLTGEQLAAAGKEMGGVETSALLAVIDIQSNGAEGFANDGRPQINFDPQVFSRLTAHRYDAVNAAVSSRNFVNTYTLSQPARWALLEQAFKLDPNAALSATAWGRFKTAGLNYKNAGFETIESFVRAQSESEVRQLAIFVAYSKSQGLDAKLRPPVDWASFSQAFFGTTRWSAFLSKQYQHHEANKQ